MGTEKYSALVEQLRAVESRSKGDLLNKAATAIEQLVRELDMVRAEREALYKGIIGGGDNG